MICLVLILAAALVIARMVKFRSQVDVTLPAVLWEDGEATAVNTTLHFHGEMVKQWGQDDSFSGYLELEDQPFTSEEASKVWLTMAHEGGGLNRGLLEYGKFPAHTFFGELYTDREYTQFFLFPFERVPGKIEGTVSYQPDTSVYVAPAVSLNEAKALRTAFRYRMKARNKPRQCSNCTDSKSSPADIPPGCFRFQSDFSSLRHSTYRYTAR